MKAAYDFKSRFHESFEGEPRVFQAPGRVNLIGEHTDYNEGLVLPMAIQWGTRVAIAQAQSRCLAVQSDNLAGKAIFNLEELPAPRGDWSDYVRGVAMILQQAVNSFPGANLLITGDVPIGAGLSSSASLEVATAYALLGISGKSMAEREIAKACQRAENEFVGSRCGIMDQFAACFGRAGHALLLDCRSLAAEYVPVSEAVRVVVSNTMVKHELASSEYNRRREECEDGVRELSRFIPGIRALRDVSMPQLERFAAQLDPKILRRCRHVVSENDRVRAAATALRRSDFAEFGRLMTCSHQSLRDDYEVSCRELDIMVEIASGIGGVYGSRMTGGGFGGCTVSLVEASASERFTSRLAEGYYEQTGIQLEIYTCVPSGGAGEEAA